MVPGRCCPPPFTLKVWCASTVGWICSSSVPVMCDAKVPLDLMSMLAVSDVIFCAWLADIACPPAGELGAALPVPLLLPLEEHPAAAMATAAQIAASAVRRMRGGRCGYPRKGTAAARAWVRRKGISPPEGHISHGQAAMTDMPAAGSGSQYAGHCDAAAGVGLLGGGASLRRRDRQGTATAATAGCEP